MDLSRGTSVLDKAVKVTVRLAIQKGEKLAIIRTREIAEELNQPMWKVAIGGDSTRMCLAISTQKLQLRSEIGAHIAELSKKAFNFGVGITIIHEGDPQLVTLSMRSAGEVNVAEIAQEHGGGGHPGAAAMVVNDAEFRSQWLKGQVVTAPNSDSLISFN